MNDHWFTNAIVLSVGSGLMMPQPSERVRRFWAWWWLALAGIFLAIAFTGCASLTSYGCKSECEPNPVAQATATKCTCQPGSPRYGEGKYIAVNEELERERIEEGEDIAPSGVAFFACPGTRRLVGYAGTSPVCIAEDRR